MEAASKATYLSQKAIDYYKLKKEKFLGKKSQKN